MTETKSTSLEQTVIDKSGLETAVVEPVGELLKAARIAANLSVREVAEELYLLPNQVEALEAGNYKRFRGEIFSKGYLRSYAKLLELDHQAIVDGYIQSQPKSTSEERQTQVRQHIQNPVKGRSVQYWFLLAVIILTFVLWWVSLDEKEVVVASIENESIVVDKHDTSLITKLDIGANKLDKSEIDNATQINNGTPLGAPEESAQVISESSTSISSSDISGDETDDLAEDTGDVVTTAAIDESLLNFSFTADCWVEVRNNNNEIIYADLKRASETLILEGNAPFRIILGYAPGVVLSYNGKTVNIDVNVENNSAQLVVGRS